ncbi:MAG TPA: TolC family protein, partial [Paraburkholderia sp.]
MSKHRVAAFLLVAAAAATHAQQAAADVEPELGTRAPITTAQAANLAQPMSLDDALRLAAENNPLLQSARFEADASNGALMQAGARPNPEISLLQEGLSGRERTSTALINQTIELGGKRRSRLDAASYRREAAL